MGRMFGTDGARGLVGVSPITFEGAEQMGRAMGAHFNLEGKNTLVGGDPRESRRMLTEGIAAGITAVGGNVIIIDVMTTPGIALNVRDDNDIDAGVILTASHNPHDRNDPNKRWNGIKILGRKGDKLDDDQEDAIEALFNTEIRDADVKGKITSSDEAKAKYAEHYLDHLVQTVGGRQIFEGMHVGLDTAHGASTGFAQELVRRLGARRITSIGDQPDGYNINEGVGATHTEGLEELVVAEGLDVAAAFDGDADRCFIIDKYGRPIDGDLAVTIGAIANGHERVALTIMTNGGIVKWLKENGIDVERTKVGDRYILEAMRRSAGTRAPITLGGEQSGHVINDEVGPTGDGMGTFIGTVDAAQRSGTTLEDWYDKSKEHLMPQELTSIAVTDKAGACNDPRVLDLVARAKEAVGDDGSVSLRPSGTGHEVRLMVESDDPSVVKEYTQEFTTIINADYAMA